MVQTRIFGASRCKYQDALAKPRARNATSKVSKDFVPVPHKHANMDKIHELIEIGNLDNAWPLWQQAAHDELAGAYGDKVPDFDLFAKPTIVKNLALPPGSPEPGAGPMSRAWRRAHQLAKM